MSRASKRTTMPDYKHFNFHESKGTENALSKRFKLKMLIKFSKEKIKKFLHAIPWNENFLSKNILIEIHEASNFNFK